MLKFSSKSVAEHAEVPLADDGKWESLVEHWTARSDTALTAEEASRCYVVSVGPERAPLVRAAQMAEIFALVASQGSVVVGQEICHLASPNPRTLLGKGKAEDIATRARACGATMLVLDAELSPSQTRNLEDVAGLPICDREAIILNVFVRHARTRRARIQVEIAQLEYLRPRIRGIGLDMDQQTGGSKNARGPGETASELMARKLDIRLEELKKARRALDTSADTQRRHRSDCKRVALVGYTNAGKTSLMNALTGAGLSARDMPFETLDTTSRSLARHGGDVLLSDTVGFIRRLPARLLESFQSTLAEVAEASLLVVVVDTSDEERALHLTTTIDLVEKMGAGDIPRLVVFNKTDRLTGPIDPTAATALARGRPWIALRSSDAQAVADLQTAILAAVRADDEELEVLVPYGARDVLALAYAKCRVLASTAGDAGLSLRLHAPRPVATRIRALMENQTA